jgi:hypothetical protein
MGDVINLADPDFEPTDEQLIELSKRAFADVKARHEAALAKLRAEIADRSARVLSECEARQAAWSKGK